MKRILFFGIILTSLVVTGCSVVNSIAQKKKEQLKQDFNVVNEVVYYKNKPVAIYQAKTFSLDGGELVEEYNLLMTSDLSNDKQIIGDLIDFISDRHQGAEVEIEVESKNSPFKL